MCVESLSFIITKTLATGNMITIPAVLKRWHPLVGFEHIQHTNRANNLAQFFPFTEVIWFPCGKWDEFRIIFCSEDEFRKLTSSYPNCTLGFFIKWTNRRILCLESNNYLSHSAFISWYTIQDRKRSTSWIGFMSIIFCCTNITWKVVTSRVEVNFSMCF